VDEIWTPTRFVCEAYRTATHKPVRLAPLPIPKPIVDARQLTEFGLQPDVFTFLVSFDHLSVMERKNPIGAIEAFVRAFPAGDEPVRLLVKTINGDRRPEASARLASAASIDPRVRVWDERLPRERHMALIQAVDGLITLHRSEGLGLHAADAMWLGTPVVATRYSGSLDLMDDDSAALVNASLIAVTNGDGAYPEGLQWADPDLDHAAALVARIVSDRAWATSLTTHALARMEAQQSRQRSGRKLKRLLAGRMVISPSWGQPIPAVSRPGR